MPDVKTPASIVAAARALVPLVGTLNSTGDPTKQAQADELSDKITDALDKASQLAAQDVIATLGNQSGPLEQLKKFDSQAQDAAARIAASEANLTKAMSFCANVVSFVGAIATGNAIAAGTQLSNMLSSLNIS